MKKAWSLLLALGLVLALSGCGREASLVGTWEGSGLDLAGEELEFEQAETWLFGRDGRVEIVLPNGKSWTCTYVITEDTLTLQEVEGGLSWGIGYKRIGDTLILNPDGPVSSGVYKLR